MYAEEKELMDKPITTREIEAFGLETIIETMEQTFYFHFIKREYLLCEDILSNFCYELLDLPEEEQIFIVRVHFRSLVTDIIQILSKKDLLHSKTLSASFKIISTIEAWEKMTDYLLHIPWFMEQLQKLVKNYPLSVNSRYVEQALHLIHHHLTSNLLTVHWLADQLEVSSTHLSNLFKMEVGELLSQYIVRRKMDEVVYELAHTNKSIRSIREKYGFSNQSHFIKNFKMIHGVTPLQFKQEQLD